MSEWTPPEDERTDDHYRTDGWDSSVDEEPDRGADGTGWDSGPDTDATTRDASESGSEPGPHESTDHGGPPPDQHRHGPSEDHHDGDPHADYHQGGPPPGHRGGYAPEPAGRWVSAIVGALVMFVVGFLLPIPIPQLMGGGLAGYLRGSDTKESAITGGIAGVLAAIPAVLAIGMVLLFFGIIGLAEGEGVIVGVGVIVALVLVAFVVVSILLCVASGAIGAAVSDRGPPGGETRQR